MDDTEVDFGDGDFGNGVAIDENEEQFHENEAISAVAETEEGFMVEEEDDYEDLYNDVNVGEGLFNNNNNNNNKSISDVHMNDELLGFSKVKEEMKNEGKDAVGVNGGQELGFKDVKLEGYGGDTEVKDGGLGGGVPKSSSAAENVFRGNSGVSGGGGMKVELGNSLGRIGEGEGEIRNDGNNGMVAQGVVMQQQQQQQQQLNVGGLGQVGNSEGFKRQGVNGGIVSNGGYSGGNGYGGGGTTTLFVGDLHWWTTDSEVEAEVCKYGNVKEVRFFDEKASGKSKGYCQVEFYEPSAAMACKEGMNGHLFNGKPCVVQLGSTYDIRKLGEAQVNKAQAIAQANLNVPPGGRGMSRGNPLGGTYQDGSNGFVRAPWRPSGPVGGRGPGGMNYRGRGRGRGVIGNGVGTGFGQGMAPNHQMMHPQAMMGGFDPSYGPNMGRMGGYGFPAAPSPPYPGMMNSYPPVGGAGMTGVAPHVNPAFFGRGMPANGMGMMPTAGMDGQGMGMWPDPGTNGWGGEDPSGRVEESNYGEDAASEHQYGDASQDRGRPNAMKEKDMASERDWSGGPPPNRKYRDDRDQASERDVPREKDGHDYEWPERRPHDDRELSRERERPRERDHDRERERGYDRDRDRDQHREERDRDRVRYREDRDRHVDHHRHKDRGSEYEEMDHYRHKDYGTEYDGEWDRGRSSRAYSKSRLPHDEDHRARSRDIEYSKRRRLPSE
ncbi:hypothetical protein ACHQM5_004420 [Ranunculus cassubicifolius]